MSDFLEKLQYWFLFNMGFFIENPLVGVAVAVVVAFLIRGVYRAGADSDNSSSGGDSG